MKQWRQHVADADFADKLGHKAIKMLIIRARGVFAFEKSRVALWEGGVAQRHAKMAWENHYIVYFKENES